MTTPTTDDDTRPSRRLPWVTIALAAINIAVFGWELAAGASVTSPSPQWLLDHGGNFGPRTLAAGESWRLLTSMFLHVGLLHLVMNMIGLIDGGRHVERMYGRYGFLALYLVSGLAGSLASALRSTSVVSAGASGAIFGVFGAFGAYLFLHRGRLDTAEVSKQARGLLVFLAYNLYIGLQVKGIDLLAHVGGLAAGFVCGIALELGTTEGPSNLRRAVVVGVLGIGLAFGTAQLVHGPTNAYAEMEKVERSVNARWREIQAAGSGPAIADGIEHDLLPTWRAGRESFERDADRGGVYDKAAEYYRTREEGWELLAKGLRADDQTLIGQANEKFEAAARILESIDAK